MLGGGGFVILAPSPRRLEVPCRLSITFFVLDVCYLEKLIYKRIYLKGRQKDNKSVKLAT